MTWLSPLISALSEDVGAAPLRMLLAIDAIAEPATPISMVLIASKADVIARLADAEGAPPGPDIQRRRIKLINDAVKALGKQSYAGHTPFTVRSRKTAFEVERNQAIDGFFDAVEKIEASARQDSEGVPAEYEAPQLVADKPHHQIFVSHAHESNEVEAVVKRFADDLERRLKHLPWRYKEKFTVGLWIDHGRMGAPDEYDDQAAKACADSMLAIFLLSDRWYDSAPCQSEAQHFGYPDVGPQRRFFTVQLSGDFNDADPCLKAAPCYPLHWRNSVGNLLALDALPLGERDAFLTRLRDEICGKLVALDGEPDPAVPKRPKLPPDGEKSARLLRPIGAQLVQNAGSANFEDVIVDGRTERPFVTPREGGNETIDAVELVVKWACGKESENRIFALLGSFGSGKTTTSQLIVRELLRRRKEEPDQPTPIPVYLDLRRVAEFYEHRREPHFDLGNLIRASLHGDIRNEIDPGQLLNFLKTESCLILFDGLDEVGTRIGPERLAALYRDLLEVIPAQAWNADRAQSKADWQVCPTRIMVTCRTHFFRDHVAQDSTLHGNDRHAGLARKPNYTPVETRYMAPFSTDQIQSFFIKLLGAELGGSVWQSMAAIPDLANLAETPIMARYLAELAPEILADANAGKPVNAASIYGHLFARTLARDGEKRPLMTVREREKLLEDLSEKLWLERTAQMPIDVLEDWFDAYTATSGLSNLVQASREDKNLLKTELRNASMLVRSGDDFSFVHTSFQEYFLARRLLRRLIDHDLERLNEMPGLSRETIAFLLDLASLEGDGLKKLGDALDRILRPDHDANVRQIAFEVRQDLQARGHSRSLPRSACLSGLDLRDLRSETQRLEGVDLSRANLLNAGFTNVVFEACDFLEANLAGTRFDECRFIRCRGMSINGAGARMHGGAADDASRATVLHDLIFVDRGGDATTVFREPGGPVRARLPEPAGQNSAMFSPDGKTVVTASDDGNARLWDVETGAELRRFEGHGAMVSSAMFSPDGAAIVTASHDGYAHLWDVETGAELRRFEGHGDTVKAAMFSPDGKSIVTASSDNSARLWDVETGAELRRFEGHGDTVKAVMFSPDGKSIVTASRHNGARLWDVETGAELRRFEGHGSMVTSAMFSPDGKSIVTASNDNSAHLWDVETGAELRRFEGFGNVVTFAMFSPDGKAVITASFDGIARLWDVETGTELRRFEGHGDMVTSARFSPDGKAVITASRDGSARIWDVETGTELRRFEGHGNVVTSAMFNSDGKVVVTASYDKSARLWDVETGAELRRFEGHENMVASAMFSPDGKAIVTAAYGKNARLWDVETGAELRRFEGHGDMATSAMFSPDGKTVVTASYDESARLWNVETGTELRRLEGHGAVVTSAMFSPDGKAIVTASQDNSARLWDVETSAEFRRFDGHEDPVASARFSPDGKAVVTASWDKTARLWDVETGAELRRFKGHESIVTSAMFSAGGKAIVTASFDGSARIWDVETGDELRRFEGHGSVVASAMFSPDGKAVITASHDGSARIWNVETGAELHRLIALPDSWARLDAMGNVTHLGRNGWKYVHGVRTGEVGKRQIVNIWDQPMAN